MDDNSAFDPATRPAPPPRASAGTVIDMSRSIVDAVLDSLATARATVEVSRRLVDERRRRPDDGD